MRVVAIALAVALSAGCKGQAPPPRTAPAVVVERPAVLGHVPAAGIEWLVVVRPGAIAKRPDIASLVKEIATERRLAAFEATVGIDLKKVRELAIAGYGPGTLYVAELGAPSAPRVRELFANRLEGGALDRQTSASVHRVFGTIHDEPVAMVSTADDFVALATTDVSLARVVEAYAAHRLRSPTALHGVALRGLSEPPPDALAAFYAAYPFDADTAHVASDLLSTAFAASLTVRGGAPGTLDLTLSLVGDFSPAPEQAAARAGEAFHALCQSSFGILLGLNEVSAPEINSDLHLLTLSAHAPLRPLVRGIGVAISGDVHEIFDVVPAAPQATPESTR